MLKKRITGAVSLAVWVYYAVRGVLGLTSDVDLVVSAWNNKDHWIWKVLAYILDWLWMLLLPIGIILVMGKGPRDLRNAFGRLRKRGPEGSMRPAVPPVPASGAINVTDEIAVELTPAPTEFRFRAEARRGGIFLIASQVFDATRGHKGRIMLTNIHGLDASGIRHTVPAFHRGEKFLRGPLELRTAGADPELHYGQDCVWSLIGGANDRPKIPHTWGVPEHREYLPHPLGEYVATIAIEAGDKRTERTVHYRLTGTTMEVISVGP